MLRRVGDGGHGATPMSHWERLQSCPRDPMQGEAGCACRAMMVAVMIAPAPSFWRRGGVWRNRHAAGRDGAVEYFHPEVGMIS
jgi:hypothetical protein